MNAVESAYIDVLFLTLHVEYILFSVVSAIPVGCSARRVWSRKHHRGGHHVKLGS